MNASEFRPIYLHQITKYRKHRAGLPRVREKSGKLKFFQGQGIVREFSEPSRKFENIGKCQGIIREKK